MPRHEVPVLTDCHMLELPGSTADGTQYAVIRFEGHIFGWHLLPEDPERGPMLPVVSLVSADRDGYREERGRVNRFLSGLSFANRAMIAPIVFGFHAQASRPEDRIMFRQPGAFGMGIGHGAPSELVIQDDDELRLALALHREGRNSLSPFYRFLAFWNALDVVFVNDEPRRDSYLRRSPSRAPGWFRGWASIPADLAAYLRDSCRNAIAHAVRDPGRPVLNPDLTVDEERVRRDARLLGEILRDAIQDRWPYPVCSRVASE